MTYRDILSQAAARLRDLAAEATEGPWGSGGGTIVARGVEQTGPSSFTYGALIADLDCVSREDCNDTDQLEADAAFIATMNPDLGAALADWLLEASMGVNSAAMLEPALGVAQQVLNLDDVELDARINPAGTTPEG